MRILLLIWFFILTAPSLTDTTIKQDSRPVVSPQELKEWVSYLASDEMKGRSNGSPEMKTAAYWIEDRFREYGVKAFSPAGDMIQEYSFVSRGNTINERNVIGIIEGTDPALKDQYIVVSAHFDHIGIRRGASPDSIRNGADDNAAGTCTVIGIAKTIKSLNLKPGRTLVLAAFSGEEAGMRGSRYFVNHSPVPLKNIYVDINFEMDGHSEILGRNKYLMTGCPYSNLDDLIKDYNKRTDFQLIDTLEIARMLFTGSDNYAFSSVSTEGGKILGIPSGTFGTATLENYYHNVTDEAGLFDFDNMAALVRHFTDMVIWLSNNRSQILWTDPKFSNLK